MWWPPTPTTRRASWPRLDASRSPACDPAGRSTSARARVVRRLAGDRGRADARFRGAHPSRRADGGIAHLRSVRAPAFVRDRGGDDDRAKRPLNHLEDADAAQLTLSPADMRELNQGGRRRTAACRLPPPISRTLWLADRRGAARIVGSFKGRGADGRLGGEHDVVGVAEYEDL